MTEITPPQSDVGPTVEVVVFQHGREVARQVCESTEEASSIVEWWNEQDGTECRVDDLSIHMVPTNSRGFSRRDRRQRLPPRRIPLNGSLY